MRPETLSEQLFFVTTRLDCVQGTELVSTGTGFIYGVEAERPSGAERGTAQFLVTNRHVAQAADEVLVRMIQRKPGASEPQYGSPAAIRVACKDSWTFHPDPDVDVAVLPFVEVLNGLTATGMSPFYKSVPSTWALTRRMVQSFDAIENVMFVGYPNALFDKANLTPIMRRGTTATPMTLDYGGKPRFLVDAAVFPGSSGSPVFISDSGTFRARDGTVKAGHRLALLGVLAAVHVRHVQADLIQTGLGISFADPLNLGLVYRAETIDAIVDEILEVSGYRRTGGPPTQPTGATSTDRSIADAA